jgi:hypothetical protein
MTFGFPAYYTEPFETTTDIDLRKAVRETFASLSWNVKEETASVMTAMVSVGVRSYGETIEVHFISPSSISVKSRCALPTQCFDWGKNKENVKRFLAALEPLL